MAIEVVKIAPKSHGRGRCKKINKTDTIEYALVVRDDWKHDEFAKVCRNTFKDVTKG